MTRLILPVAAAMVLAVIPSCERPPDYEAYDNTLEREAFYKRYNAEVVEKLAKRKTELEASLGGDLPAEDRTAKQQEYDDLLRRMERPEFFEMRSEADLPQDLVWTTNLDDPELGSPEAKKGGTFHTYIPGGGYPPNIRCVGREANNSFRSYHWDDIELSLVGYHPETGNVMPVLADRWAVAADRQTVYFHIDDTAKLSDGREVTSGDWMMSFYVYLSDYLTEPFYRAYFGEQ